MSANKYVQLDLHQVKKLAEYGHSDEYMAMFFGVHPSTWADWKAQYPDFGDKLRAWKQVPDGKVRQAMLKRALGCFVTEEKMDKDGCVRPLRKELPPDVGACKFWLVNRVPQEFSDKQDHDLKVSGALTHTVKTDEVELEERIKNIVETSINDSM